jgi:hypothetical protein
MNIIFNYGFIFICTTFAIIALVNINMAEKIFNNEKGGKPIFIFIILMSYMTLVAYPINNILKNKIVVKTLIPGDKGSRGYRGESGKRAICNTCGDDLCLKKILFNITNTYNYWRELQGLDLYPDTYVIKNEFLKDKIRKQCSSTEFKTIIKKYGSNKKCTSINDMPDSCGIYDYLFNMWSIWILIILKYKNGFFFLESDSLTDRDFDGLIESEDSFKTDDTVSVIKDKDPSVLYKIFIKNNMYPYFSIKNTNGKYETKHVNELNLHTGIDSDWKNMFADEVGDKYNNAKIKKNIDESTKKYESVNFNDTFYENSGTPSRGKLSPFDEIENYKAWYWGRNKRLVPKIIIKPYTDLSPLEKTCDKKTNGIKTMETNNFYELFSTKKISQANNFGDSLDPFKQYGSSNITFFRAKTYVDNDEHHFFKTYKPLGDIIIKEDELVDNNTAESKQNCLPNIENYVKNIYDQKTNNKNTILVSGDIKSPVDYDMVFTDIKTSGINKYSEGFTVWKPIPPDGYEALGYIIDNRPYKDGSEPPKPSLNIVACVKNDALTVPNPPFSINSIWNSTNTLNGRASASTGGVSLYRNPELNTFINNGENYKNINQSSICNTSGTTDTSKPIPPLNNPRKGIKDKKFSILRLYD